MLLYQQILVHRIGISSDELKRQNSQQFKMVKL